jgi:hypothetical protein
MKLSKRAKLEITSELSHAVSWKAFEDYRKQLLTEKKNQLAETSKDITQFLVREQLIGVIIFLENFTETFHNHVANVIETDNENNVK